MNKKKGGKRIGAGRKPKSFEDNLISTMDAYLHPDEVCMILAKQVKAGEVQALKLWLAYRFGQPTQTINQNNTGDQKIIIVRDGTDSYPPRVHSSSGTDGNTTEA